MPGRDMLNLWNRCDGTRPLESFPPAEQQTLQRWHEAGLVLAAPPPDPTARADLTVVSPHPDDAQLALGGLLAARGGHVVGVFTEETWTRRPYYRSRPKLTSDLLRAEELAACRVLGVSVAMLGFPEAPHRPAWRDGFLTSEDDIGRIVHTETELFGALLDALGPQLVGAGVIAAPLGVGGHVDHLLVREAVIALIGLKVISPDRVLLYEDMPYSVFGGSASCREGLAPRAEIGPLHEVPAITTPAHAMAKGEALRAYRLQVTPGTITRVLRQGSGGETGAFTETLWAPRRWEYSGPDLGVTER
ncbi:PIG-L deacetylase family protein [Actinoplanes derwentensis]|uniref:N-acetylglucosaminyl deacetylase, LmbE family n=1 Tax=Actinoplanes derwentensis TaxID=113562 RepID=A0A1H2DDH1_9ACTN|nr:PIG-L family deacetylase [Actinoplanes derwentensis]SDT80770.1 N-acetylglucosaminyl deacetylase, LmbE family [Actinoplanes derwentensis]